MIIIDRFEGKTAVLETDEGTVEVYRGQLPENACEGDVLLFLDGAWSIDTETTEQRRAAMRSRMKKLLKKDD